MGKFFIASIFIFTFCVFAFGQNSNCPTISLIGPSTPEELKQPLKFKVTVTGIDLSKIQYGWSVSEGEIVQGQGTDTIFVRSKTDARDFTPTVTVDINGFPEGCQSSDSETGIIVCGISEAREIDFFELTADPIDEKRLDVLVSELEDDPNATANILIYSRGKMPSKSVKKKEAFIRKYLNDKKIADNRIGIINTSEDETDRVRIFIVPLGAEPITP